MLASDLPVIRIEALDLRFAAREWRFASERRREIDAHFGNLRRERPALWNGRVLLLARHELDRTVLRGEYLETDFASFIAWRDWDFPDREITNCFAYAAVRPADGGFILGEMGEHTANAGRVYFPGGTPDPSDIIDGRVDLEGSVRRELAEETGFQASDFAIEPHWFAVLAAPRIALIKLFRSQETFVELRARARRHFASEAEPELADIHWVRSESDFDTRIPEFVWSFLLSHWRGEAA